MILRTWNRRVPMIVSLVVCEVTTGALAQSAAINGGGTSRRLSLDEAGSPSQHHPARSVTIDWQRVPLCEAIGRLKPLFEETVFVDRRVDPSLRVSLQTEATSAEQVVAQLASEHELGVARLGKLIYLGPRPASDALRGLAALRAQQVARLPTDARQLLARRQAVAWPRLSEPSKIVESLLQPTGWRLAHAERIPYDLWAAGELPDASVADQLTVLLLGFDLTFELAPGERAVAVVPLTETAKAEAAKSVVNRTPPKTASAHSARGQNSRLHVAGPRETSRRRAARASATVALVD